MTSQEQFEKSYAEAHDMPLETFKEYRMGDTYRLPMIAKCWRFWQMAVEKPDALIAQLQSDLTARDEEIDALRSQLHQANSAGQPAVVLEIKPSWEDAPDFANWLAQDADGRWFWYEAQPTNAPEDSWCKYGGSEIRFAGSTKPRKRWWFTLERRPCTQEKH